MLITEANLICFEIDMKSYTVYTIQYSKEA